MVDAWLTTMSTNLEAVINPLTAACEAGFLPDELTSWRTLGLATNSMTLRR